MSNFKVTDQINLSKIPTLVIEEKASKKLKKNKKATEKRR